VGADEGGYDVSRRQLALVVAILLIASTFSAFIAYRVGLRHRAGPAAALGVGSESKTGDCVPFSDAGARVGTAGCVRGRILRVFTSRAGNTFLDFCPDYRRCPFTCVIFADDRGKFGDLNALGGQQVELRGPVTIYEGRAEIIIHDPQQIRVVP
jgi:hypothetical protein